MRAIWATLVCLVIVTVTNHSYFCEAASVSGQLLDNSTNVSNETLNNATELSTITPPIEVVAVLSTNNFTVDDTIAVEKLKTSHGHHDDDDDDDDDHDHDDDDDDDDDDDKRKKKIKKVLKKKNKGGVPTVLSITETILDGNATTKRPCPLGHRPTFGGNSTLDAGSNVTSADRLAQGTALEKISESIVHALGTIKNSVTSIFVPGTGLPKDEDDLDCRHNETLGTNSTGNGTASLPVSMDEGSSVNSTEVPVELNVTTTTELPLVPPTTLPAVIAGEMGNLTTISPSTSTQGTSEGSISTSTVGTSTEAPVAAGP